MSTFVSIGNGHQPFTRLLDAVDAIADNLPQPVVVQHGHTPFASTRCTATAFMPMDEFMAQIVHARLVIIHGGVGSILSALQGGGIPIVVPRLAAMGEIIDDHQLDLARALASVGRVALVEDTVNLGAAVMDAAAHNCAAPATRTDMPLVAMVKRILSDVHARNRASA